MEPFDLAVVLGADEIIYHQVWASTESEAYRAIALFYRDSTVIGIVFAAQDREC